MASDLAIGVRDRLNAMVDELTEHTDDQEANVLACCVALAVEEVEKWMYKGDFTPSVAPYREGKEWEMPFKDGEENDAEFTGPAWARKRKDAWSDMPAFQRLKAKAEKQPVLVRNLTVLDSYSPGDWDKQTMNAFRAGNRPVFISRCGTMVPGVKVSLKDASEYASRMVREYPQIWGIDIKIPSAGV